MTSMAELSIELFLALKMFWPSQSPSSVLQSYSAIPANTKFRKQGRLGSARHLPPTHKPKSTQW